MDELKRCRDDIGDSTDRSKWRRIIALVYFTILIACMQYVH